MQFFPSINPAQKMETSLKDELSFQEIHLLIFKAMLPPLYN
jgi:hypothetical protein